MTFKLPPLPPMRPRKSGPARPRVTRDDEKADLVIVLPDLVSPAPGEDTRQWFRVDQSGVGKGVQWGGRCAKCGRLVPALMLKPVIPPFKTSEDEEWRCTSCRKASK